MRKVLSLILCLPLLFALSCEKKGGGHKVDPGGDDTEMPDPAGFTYMKSFTEDFEADSSEFFSFKYKVGRDDFRYFSGVPSLSARNTDILMLRIDPADVAGESRGARIVSKDYCYYGSYSVRLRLPDIRKAQPNVGVVASFSVFNDDSPSGEKKVGLEWRIANPMLLYISATMDDKPDADVLKTINLSESLLPGYDASAKFFVCGFDWYPDKTVWWVENPSTLEKTIVLEDSGGNLPTRPGHLRFDFWHSKLRAAQNIPTSIEAPRYPFELEVDKIVYSAFDDLNPYN